jgi:hypothetical protein
MHEIQRERVAVIVNTDNRAATSSLLWTISLALPAARL